MFYRSYHGEGDYIVLVLEVKDDIMEKALVIQSPYSNQKFGDIVSGCHMDYFNDFNGEIKLCNYENRQIFGCIKDLFPDGLPFI